METQYLLEEQAAIKKKLDRPVLKAIGFVFASFVLYPFLFAVIPGDNPLNLLVLIGWPVVVVYSFFNVAWAIHTSKKVWLTTQADFLQRWLTEEHGFELGTGESEIDRDLIVTKREVIRIVPLQRGGEVFYLYLFKDEVGDRKKLNFFWYRETSLRQDITGVTYLTAESDFSHRLFKEFETETTLLEWGQFEDLLHVGSTDAQEARYLLPPNAMQSIYDTWAEYKGFLGRIKFSNNKAKIISGPKRLQESDERVTLLDGDSPMCIIRSFELMNQLARSVDRT